MWKWWNRDNVKLVIKITLVYIDIWRILTVLDELRLRWMACPALAAESMKPGPCKHFELFRVLYGSWKKALWKILRLETWDSWDHSWSWIFGLGNVQLPGKLGFGGSIPLVLLKGKKQTEGSEMGSFQNIEPTIPWFITGFPQRNRSEMGYSLRHWPKCKSNDRQISR